MALGSVQVVVGIIWRPQHISTHMHSVNITSDIPYPTVLRRRDNQRAVRLHQRLGAEHGDAAARADWRAPGLATIE